MPLAPAGPLSLARFLILLQLPEHVCRPLVNLRLEPLLGVPLTPLPGPLPLLLALFAAHEGQLVLDEARDRDEEEDGKEEGGQECPQIEVLQEVQGQLGGEETREKRIVIVILCLGEKQVLSQGQLHIGKRQDDDQEQVEVEGEQESDEVQVVTKQLRLSAYF
jgi:hypothetical protein